MKQMQHRGDVKLIQVKITIIQCSPKLRIKLATAIKNDAFVVFDLIFNLV